MTHPQFHLAEVNIGKLRAPLTDPVMSDFVAQLDAINALAEQSDGFVWRLKSDDGGPSSYIRAFPDAAMAVNLSVWTSVEALRAYVYRSDHAEVLRQRARWFERIADPFAMWWIPAGTIPTIEDAVRRLSLLAEKGPTAEAFTFKQLFAPPGSQAAEAIMNA